MTKIENSVKFGNFAENPNHFIDLFFVPFFILFSDQTVDNVYSLILTRFARQGGKAAGKAVQY